MTAIAAVALYTGLIILLMGILKLNVGRARIKTRTNLGDGGGNDSMVRAIRVQGNAVEDVPVALLGLFALAGVGAPVLVIHVLGAALLAARVLHAVGLGGVSGLGFGRLVGTLGTMLLFIATAAACIYYAVS